VQRPGERLGQVSFLLFGASVLTVFLEGDSPVVCLLLALAGCGVSVVGLFRSFFDGCAPARAGWLGGRMIWSLAGLLLNLVWLMMLLP
jgi:hypothetical protein